MQRRPLGRGWRGRSWTCRCKRRRRFGRDRGDIIGRAKHRRGVEKLRSGLLCLRDLDTHCHKANGQNELALIAHPRSHAPHKGHFRKQSRQIHAHQVARSANSTTKPPPHYRTVADVVGAACLRSRVRAQAAFMQPVECDLASGLMVQSNNPCKKQSIHQLFC